AGARDDCGRRAALIRSVLPAPSERDAFRRPARRPRPGDRAHEPAATPLAGLVAGAPPEERQRHAHAAQHLHPPHARRLGLRRHDAGAAGGLDQLRAEPGLSAHLPARRQRHRVHACHPQHPARPGPAPAAAAPGVCWRGRPDRDRPHEQCAARALRGGAAAGPAGSRRAHLELGGRAGRRPVGRKAALRRPSSRPHPAAHRGGRVALPARPVPCLEPVAPGHAAAGLSRPAAPRAHASGRARELGRRQRPREPRRGLRRHPQLPARRPDQARGLEEGGPRDGDRRRTCQPRQQRKRRAAALAGLGAGWRRRNRGAAVTPDRLGARRRSRRRRLGAAAARRGDRAAARRIASAPCTGDDGAVAVISPTLSSVRTAWPGWNRLPRDTRDTFFLLAVIAWTVLPHVPHLPLWSVLLSAGVLAWRAWLALRSAPLPGRATVITVLVGALVLTWWSHRTLLGKDAGVTLLVTLVALKTLELRARRDAFVIFFLGFFLVLTHFLYSQAMLTAATMLVSVWGLLTALVLAHMPVGQPSLGLAARLAARFALLGAPIMALLFVLFPRVSPLWGVPNDAASRTGLS